MQCAPQAIAFGPAISAAIKLLALHAPPLFFAFILARTLLPEKDFLTGAGAALLLYFFALTLPLWALPAFSFPWLLARAEGRR